jgi:uncharacterized protein YgiM (DUF1202 family)
MTKRINLYSALLLTLFLCLAAAPARAQTSQEDNDPGVDVAIVTAQTANMRADASTSSRVLRQLQQNAVLVILDRTPVNGWYNVLDIKSSDEGWINQNLVYVRFTRKRATLPNFSEERMGTSEPPLIEITNDTSETLSLRIGAERYSIPPNTVRSLTHSPGTFKFYASVPDALPRVGEKTWQTGIKYTWRFYIRTSPR